MLLRSELAFREWKLGREIPIVGIKIPGEWNSLVDEIIPLLSDVVEPSWFASPASFSLEIRWDVLFCRESRS